MQSDRLCDLHFLVWPWICLFLIYTCIYLECSPKSHFSSLQFSFLAFGFSHLFLLETPASCLEADNNWWERWAWTKTVKLENVNEKQQAESGWNTSQSRADELGGVMWKLSLCLSLGAIPHSTHMIHVNIGYHSFYNRYIGCYHYKIKRQYFRHFPKCLATAVVSSIKKRSLCTLLKSQDVSGSCCWNRNWSKSVSPSFIVGFSVYEPAKKSLFFDSASLHVIYVRF